MSPLSTRSGRNRPIADTRAVPHPWEVIKKPAIDLKGGGAAHQARCHRFVPRCARPSRSLVCQGRRRHGGCLCAIANRPDSGLCTRAWEFGRLADCGAGIPLAVKLIPEPVMMELRAKALEQRKPTSKAGLVAMVLIWFAAIALTIRLDWPNGSNGRAKVRFPPEAVVR